jgi:hypothetical protein
LKMIRNPAPFRRVGGMVGRTLLGLSAAALAMAAKWPGNAPDAGVFAAALARSGVSAPIARAETAVPSRPELPRLAVEIADRVSAAGGDRAAEPVEVDAPAASPADSKPDGAPPISPAEGNVLDDPDSPDGDEAPDPDGGASGDEGPGSAEPHPFGFDEPEPVPPSGSGPDSPLRPFADDPEAPVDFEAPDFGDDALPSDSMPPLVEYAAGRLSIQAEGEPLGAVLAELRDLAGVEIDGLNPRRDEPLFFRADHVPVERALKRLMRHLKETNFAFEYSRTRLRRISVFPAGRTEAVARVPDPPASDAPETADRRRAVRVVNIHEGTQAEILDLQRGDLIVEYDGRPIASAQELVEAVKERSPEQIVQMTVVRDGLPFPVSLNGGLIGINILTVNVPEEIPGR